MQVVRDGDEPQRRSKEWLRTESVWIKDLSSGNGNEKVNVSHVMEGTWAWPVTLDLIPKAVKTYKGY